MAYNFRSLYSLKINISKAVFSLFLGAITLPLLVMNRLFKTILFLVAGVFLGIQFYTGDTFSSTEKSNDVKVEKVVSKEEGLFSTLKNKSTNKLDPQQWEKFKSDFKNNLAALQKINENSALLDTWKTLDALEEKILKRNFAWLQRVYDWSRAGVLLFKKNGENLKLLDASEETFGEFINGHLLPEKYDFPVNTSAKSIGTPCNGYQVVKDKIGDFFIRRAPDTSPYNDAELTELTQHPKAHVLERHGPDIPIEALIKRAKSPSYAPDGKRSRKAPSYASKFESPERLKVVLNKTKPGTAIFDPPAGVTSYAFDYPSAGETTIPFGYGIASGKNRGACVEMYRVKVVYRKVGDVWKLLTMYPQP